MSHHSDRQSATRTLTVSHGIETTKTTKHSEINRSAEWTDHPIMHCTRPTGH